MKNNILSNSENYNSELNENEILYFLKYVGLIHEIIEIANGSISMQNYHYLKYILIKAITNTNYIYNFLLLYTKNLELVVYHTQKSILYYIEFISQISDDNHSSLKLNSNDATLFIYKKTIFDVNEDFRNKYNECHNTKNKLNNINIYIKIYNSIILQYIDNLEHSDGFLHGLQEIVYTKLYKIVESLIQLNLKDSQVTDKLDKLDNLIIIIYLLNNNYNKSFVKNNYLLIIEYIIKKIKKNSINVDIFKQKIYNDQTDEYIKDYTICKIVNYLTC